jgi:hypothetical protein
MGTYAGFAKDLQQRMIKYHETRGTITSIPVTVPTVAFGYATNPYATNPATAAAYAMPPYFARFQLGWGATGDTEACPNMAVAMMLSNFSGNYFQNNANPLVLAWVWVLLDTHGVWQTGCYAQDSNTTYAASNPNFIPWCKKYPPGSNSLDAAYIAGGCP